MQLSSILSRFFPSLSGKETSSNLTQSESSTPGFAAVLSSTSRTPADALGTVDTSNTSDIAQGTDRSKPNSSVAAIAKDSVTDRDTLVDFQHDFQRLSKEEQSDLLTLVQPLLGLSPSAEGGLETLVSSMHIDLDRSDIASPSINGAADATAQSIDAATLVDGVYHALQGLARTAHATTGDHAGSLLDTIQTLTTAGRVAHTRTNVLAQNSSNVVASNRLSVPQTELTASTQRVGEGINSPFNQSEMIDATSVLDDGKGLGHRGLTDLTHSLRRLLHTSAPITVTNTEAVAECVELAIRVPDSVDAETLLTMLNARAEYAGLSFTAQPVSEAALAASSAQPGNDNGDTQSLVSTTQGNLTQPGSQSSANTMTLRVAFAKSDLAPNREADENTAESLAAMLQQSTSQSNTNSKQTTDPATVEHNLDAAVRSDGSSSKFAVSNNPDGAASTDTNAQALSQTRRDVKSNASSTLHPGTSRADIEMSTAKAEDSTLGTTTQGSTQVFGEKRGLMSGSQSSNSANNAGTATRTQLTLSDECSSTFSTTLGFDGASLKLSGLADELVSLGVTIDTVSLQLSTETTELHSSSKSAAGMQQPTAHESISSVEFGKSTQLSTLHTAPTTQQEAKTSSIFATAAEYVESVESERFVAAPQHQFRADDLKTRSNEAGIVTSMFESATTASDSMFVSEKELSLAARELDVLRDVMVRTPDTTSEESSFRAIEGFGALNESKVSAKLFSTSTVTDAKSTMMTSTDRSVDSLRSSDTSILAESASPTLDLESGSKSKGGNVDNTFTTSLSPQQSVISEPSVESLLVNRVQLPASQQRNQEVSGTTQQATERRVETMLEQQRDVNPSDLLVAESSLATRVKTERASAIDGLSSASVSGPNVSQFSDQHLGDNKNASTESNVHEQQHVDSTKSHGHSAEHPANSTIGTRVVRSVPTAGSTSGHISSVQQTGTEQNNANSSTGANSTDQNLDVARMLSVVKPEQRAQAEGLRIKRSQSNSASTISAERARIEQGDQTSEEGRVHSNSLTRETQLEADEESVLTDASNTREFDLSSSGQNAANSEQQATTQKHNNEHTGSGSTEGFGLILNGVGSHAESSSSMPAMNAHQQKIFGLTPLENRAMRTHAETQGEAMPRVFRVPVDNFSANTSVIVKNLSVSNGGAARLIMSPEALGTVVVNLNLQESQRSLSIEVANESARQAVESQMPQLREQLAQQGVRVDSIGVQVRDTEKTQNSQNSFQHQQSSQHKHEEREARASFARSFDQRSSTDGEARGKGDSQRERRMKDQRRRSSQAFEHYA